MNLFQKIKALIVVNNEVNKIKEASKMKEGIKTTEFWLTVLSSVLTIWFAISGMIPAEIGVKIVAASVMVFSIARAIVKFTPTKKDDELLAKIEEIIKQKAQ